MKTIICSASRNRPDPDLEIHDRAPLPGRSATTPNLVRNTLRQQGSQRAVFFAGRRSLFTTVKDGENTFACPPKPSRHGGMRIEKSSRPALIHCARCSRAWCGASPHHPGRAPP